MVKTSLLLKVSPHGDASLLMRVIGVGNLTVHDLVEGKDPRADAELAELARIPGVKVPTFRTRVESMDKSRTTDI